MIEERYRIKAVYSPDSKLLIQVNQSTLDDVLRQIPARATIDGLVPLWLEMKQSHRLLDLGIITTQQLVLVTFMGNKYLVAAVRPERPAPIAVRDVLEELVTDNLADEKSLTTAQKVVRRYLLSLDIDKLAGIVDKHYQ